MYVHMCVTDNRCLLFMGRTRAEKEKYAQKLRDNPTKAEKLVLDWLKQQGQHYPRHQFQVIIIGWIVDFLFPAQSVILEIDGSVHEKPEQKALDLLRTKTLWKAGYTVIRCKNSDVFYLGVEYALKPLTRILSKKGGVCIFAGSETVKTACKRRLRHPKASLPVGTMPSRVKGFGS